MCYIALVKNQSQSKQLKIKIADKLEWNDDGAFVGSLGGTGLRTLDNKLAEQAVLNMELDNLLVHLRQATTGGVSLNNVQGWELNGWVCVHNGTVGKFSGGKNDNDSDSLRFFRLLTRQLGTERNPKRFKKAIRKLCYDKSFYGRAMVYNPLLDVLLMFGDWELYEVSGAIIFSSTYLYGLSGKTTKQHNGLVFEYSEGVAVGESKLEGIYIMDFAKTADWKLTKIGELREHKTTYQYTEYKPTAGYGLKPVIVPEKELIIKLPAQKSIVDGDVVGFDLGGTSIILVNDELHTITGSCCMAGQCDTLWDYLDKETADDLIKSGVVYKKTINPFYIGV